MSTQRESKMKPIRTLCLLVLAMCFSWNGLADKKDEQRAAEAFKKGIDLYNTGKMDEAVGAFRRADALNPSWKIQYNIGQCEASLKRYGLAIEAFEQYLGQGGDEVPVERRDEVLRELDRLRRMVGTIIIKGEPDVDIYVDIVKYANTSSRSSIQVTAGVAHEITFMKKGKKLGSVKLLVSGGEVVELPVDSPTPTTVSVAAPPPAAPAASPAPAPASPAPAAPAAYSTMRQIKEALRAGTITRQDYARYQAEIRQKLAAEYDTLKRDLRARKITKREYETKIVETKRKYEGE